MVSNVSDLKPGGQFWKANGVCVAVRSITHQRPLLAKEDLRCAGKYQTHNDTMTRSRKWTQFLKCPIKSLLGGGDGPLYGIWSCEMWRGWGSFNLIIGGASHPRLLAEMYDAVRGD